MVVEVRIQEKNRGPSQEGRKVRAVWKREQRGGKRESQQGKGWPVAGHWGVYSLVEKVDVCWVERKGVRRRKQGPHLTGWVGRVGIDLWSHREHRRN